jgi:hypothetical protein
LHNLDKIPGHPVAFPEISEANQMKHVLEMAAVLLAITCAAAQTPKPAAQVPKPATVNAAQKSVAMKAEKEQLPFEVVSAKRVDSVDGLAGSSLSWKKDDPRTGLIVVLKRKSPAKSLMLYSADFSLHDSASDFIPASPVVGVSSGMKTPGESHTWILGVVSATKIDEGGAYFALLFEAHKKHQDFSLRYAVPLADGIKVAAQ